MPNQYTNVAIGDLGTQFFWFNKDSTFTNKSEGTGNTGAFEYALPVTAGAEFGGDTESFEAPETDLDYVPKIGGRTTLNDVEYTINYTKEKYARIEKITNNIIPQVYMEVFQDGSAAIYKGTSGIPTIGTGDPRPLTLTIMPDYLCVVQDIYNLTEKNKADIDSLVADMKALYATDDETYETLNLYRTISSPSTTYALIIDTDSIPAQRQKYEASNA